jgi:DNA-binding transcriptional LysR family regulator
MHMTMQQLRYVVAVAQTGSITEAAKLLYISQPSLSTAIKEIETKAGITIFVRSRLGISLTKEGMEFLGYARQVLQQMELLEDRYTSIPQKTKFGVSTQHYTFAENAFVDLVKRFGQERYEFYFNETGTYQILEDVKNRVSDLGILYLSEENELVLMKVFEEYQLHFTLLFSAKPHIFLQKNHPLAGKERLCLDDLKPYPRLNFVQGNYESAYYAEELFRTVPSDKEIRINDRGAIVNFMLGLNAYTISSGIFPKYLHGEDIIAIPLDEKERIQIGYVINERQNLSELGEIYISELRKYAPE